MGNAIYFCMLQPMPTVRVIRSDGKVSEFEHPVIAKQLMKAFPGHLVVHCSEIPRHVKDAQQQSKVSMLRPDDTLTPGQTYCLLRVPPSRGKQTRTTSGDKPKTTQNLRRLMFGSPEDDEDGHEQAPPPAAQLQHQSQHIGPWRPQLDAIIESPLHPNASSRANSITMSPLARQAGYVPRGYHHSVQSQTVSPATRMATSY